MQEKKLEAMYLDWVNNFLTVESFADYYAMDKKSASLLIEALRIIFEKK